MLTAILFTLIGITLGQHLKVTPSPELTAAIARVWPQLEGKTISATKTVVKAIKVRAKQIEPLALEGEQ